jgi:hypothetical protein
VQGRLTGDSCKQVAALCQMVDMLCACAGNEFGTVLCSGLLKAPPSGGDRTAAKSAKRPRAKAAKAKAEHSEAASLDVRCLCCGVIKLS